MRFLFTLMMLATLVGAAFAQPADYSQLVSVCPVAEGETEPPDFGGADCDTIPLVDINPHDRAIWVRLHIDVAPELLDAGVPLGLYVSGKMTTAAWVNGRAIGANGTPGLSRSAERPGAIDAVIFLPRDAVRPGRNTIELQMSAQRGPVRLNNPLHRIAIYRFGDPTRFLLSAYWPALVTLGIFVTGFASFGILALRGEDRWASALLCTMCVFAAGQLVTETLRGIWSYPYHWHDWRLIGLVVFASLFGVALSAFLAMKAARMTAMAGGLYVAGVWVVTMAVISRVGGFDYKTATALLVPAVAGIGLSAWGMWQRHRPAPLWLAALVTFLLVFWFSEDQFLDRYFFFVIAGFLFALFAIQAVSYSRERRERIAEESRSRRLEAALDLARERAAPSDIAVTAPGRMEKISTARISHLKGAGDYVELHTDDGQTVLHGGTLGALEEALPATFLRVHRSYIVNTVFVRALERDASGTGLLMLSTGTEIPVSRRVLPEVRKALGRHDVR